MKRPPFLAVTGLLLAFLFLFAPPVQGRATTETMTVHKEVMTFPATNPCSGVNGTVTVTFNGIMHMSSDSVGGLHFTFTQTGSFVFVQDNGVTYTGRFAIWGGGNGGPERAAAFTFTFSAHATGSDGSILRWNSVMHMTVNPDGTAASHVERLNCR